MCTSPAVSLQSLEAAKQTSASTSGLSQVHVERAEAEFSAKMRETQTLLSDERESRSKAETAWSQERQTLLVRISRVEKDLGGSIKECKELTAQLDEFKQDAQRSKSELSDLQRVASRSTVLESVEKQLEQLKVISY